jgi:hypothetical protein
VGDGAIGAIGSGETGAGGGGSDTGVGLLSIGGGGIFFTISAIVSVPGSEADGEAAGGLTASTAGAEETCEITGGATGNEAGGAIGGGAV